MTNHVQISGSEAHTAAAYTGGRQTKNAQGNFGDVLEAQDAAGRQAREQIAREQADREATAADRQTPEETAGDTDYRQQLLEHMEEMADRVRHGTIQPKIRIGAQEYTQEEWKKLLEKIDDAEEELQEALRAEIEAMREKAARELAEKEQADGAVHPAPFAKPR